MSLVILNKIKDSPLRLSKFLENDSFIEEIGDEDSFMLEIYSLISKNFINLQQEYDEEEGDDYSLEITDMGKSFLSYKDKD